MIVLIIYRIYQENPEDDRVGKQLSRNVKLVVFLGVLIFHFLKIKINIKVIMPPIVREFEKVSMPVLEYLNSII